MAFGWRQAPADAQQWTRLIDSRVTYPGVGQFERCFDISYDGTSIAFTGITTSGTEGIFRYSTATNQLQEVSVYGDAMPGSPTHQFEQFGPPIIDQGVLAFYGSTGLNGFDGLYEQVSSSAALTRVADATSGLGTYFDTYDRPGLDAGTIAFVAHGGNLYTHDSTGYHFILGQNTQMPGDTQNFSFVTKPAIENGEIVFVGLGGTGSPTENGIYAWQNGTLRTVVNGLTSLPGGGVFQNEGTDDRLITLSGSSIQFDGLINTSGPGVLATYVESSPGQLQRVYAYGDPYPANPGVTIGGTGFQAYDDGVGVYDLDSASPNVFGLYYEVEDGPLLPLLTDGVFDGRQLSRLQVVAGSFQNSEIAVDASFSDGSSGVYLVSVPVPEPATGVLACMACVVPFMRNFGRRIGS
ncbi:MAG: hypothetical protein ABSH08_01590 [Tepidisphaeraceae bacterium]|jgi:hypothetical protein